jgi:prolyl-tRNA editing enzyme YbaK/EbsC (Cys-tRNA(Pro) deacylase)
VKKVNMARESDIKNKLKSSIGLVAPFGVLYGIPTYFDRGLAKNKNLILAAGTYTESLRMAAKAYIKLIEPVIGSFAASK